MDLTSRVDIKKLLQKYETQPLKRLGQNFLIDKGAINKFIEAAELKRDDIVLEIGPGIGNLTQELAQKTRKIIAIEKDPVMCEILRETLKDFKNIEIIQGDIRQIENRKLKIKNYKVVASLPFYLATPIIRKFLESENPPNEIILIIQKEVAQRICAKPPHMNLLAVSVQFYAKPEIIDYVSKKSFWPQPKVDSAIIKITINGGQQTVNKDLFFRIVKAGFSQPRKQLINNLSKHLKLDKIKTEEWLLGNSIQPIQRAETLSVRDWIKLTKNFRMK